MGFEIHYTGTDGQMFMAWNQNLGSLDLYFATNLGPGYSPITIPWTVTVFGQQRPWKNFTYTYGGGPQYVGRVWVGYTQNVTFHMGATNTAYFGGPTDFTETIDVSIPGDINAPGRALIKVGAVYKLAVPLINVNGVWIAAHQKVRHAGYWRNTWQGS
jgi:hypothetical protein